MNNQKIAQILLPLAFDDGFSYFVPSDLEVNIGDVVLVNFVNRNIYGIVVEIKAAEALPEAPKFKIKNILAKNENVKISPNLIKLIEFAANYNLGKKGLFLKLAISILNSTNKAKTWPPKKEVSENVVSKRVKAKIPLIPEIDKAKFNLKELSQNQQQIADFLKEKILENKHNVVLLDGVTGSGKTEVYFAAISDILAKKSGQILILLPEIVLADQLLQRFEKQFGFKPEIWHSKINNNHKKQLFYALNKGEVRVLIGTRSALFLPFSDLKLVIVDEEHESSFKQEDIVNYHGRDMAILRAKFEEITIILSSATPSLETFSNAKSGKYHHQILENKFFNSNVAKVELVDMRVEKLPKDRYISSKLKEEIAKALAAKEQVLLFLNRRGYAPLTLCKSCGFKVACVNCSSYATYHQKIDKLICHHCGYEVRGKNNCKSCLAENSLITLGAGVERIAEEIGAAFKGAKIATMTSDTIDDSDESKQIIKDIIDNEIDIIIGTQIIAKGHHFPHLSLVGIIDGDGSFNNANLRAAEKSFQLLTQVIGRAGREKHKAKILLQSYNTENLLFKYIIDQNRDDFLNLEIKNRQIIAMPPFSKMVAIIFISKDEDLAIKTAKFVLQNFQGNDRIEIFGPAPMPISKIRKNYYYRLLVKSDKKLNISKLVKSVLDNIKIANNVRVKIDVDPI